MNNIVKIFGIVLLITYTTIPVSAVTYQELMDAADNWENGGSITTQELLKMADEYYNPKPSTPQVTQQVAPQVNNGFFGYTFGNGDCGRFGLFRNQIKAGMTTGHAWYHNMTTRRAWYYMESISHDNGRTVTQMVKYCKRF